MPLPPQIMGLRLATQHASLTLLVGTGRITIGKGYTIYPVRRIVMCLVRAHIPSILVTPTKEASPNLLFGLVRHTAHLRRCHFIRVIYTDILD
jgi:hypothetical protein